MTTLFKIAAGILGGIAIVASLGGFGGKKSVNNEHQQQYKESDGEEIPDSIFDGIRPEPSKRCNSNIVMRNEENIRDLQNGFTRASSILGHISIIINSIIKMFYDDPCLRVTPTTIIV